ncbi:MAG: hypothetical protein EAZ55_08560 [Cytophagales bacterium]|nr:MAG: hypothetical protein EAZ55_08560 [Cytophagales bacterium]
MTKELNANEIKALISLLDDEDREVIMHVESQIVSMGTLVIPFLEHEWESNFNATVQKRIEDLIRALQLNHLYQKLKEWKENEQENLLKGVFLIATYQYPDLEYKKIKKQVDQIYYDAWLSHRTYASPFEQIRNINNVFFEKYNFVANTQNFHSPGNSMVNIVLESKKGNPISLCIIYMLIAQKLKMPVYGVNLPNLFVLTYKSPETQFYINIFYKGAVFSKADIDSYIQQLNIKSETLYYEPCSNIDILQRILRNLIMSFEKLGEKEKVNEIQKLLDILID